MKRAFKTSFDLLFVGFAGVASSALAQTPNEATEIEQIVVTGSYIRRNVQQESASPLATVGQEQLADAGIATVTDLFKGLTINTGSQFNSNAFTQQLTTGTSQVNLRGLGLGSTLVLLNGRRQTTAAAAANDGSTFVDINSLVPTLAIERVEILKDGAAALYGTDAVAGVVNFITRDEFDGFEVETNYQRTTDGPQQDLTVGAIFGTGDEDTRFMAAFSYFDREGMLFAERSFSANSATSGLGQPGAFVSLTGGAPRRDPQCAQLSNIAQLTSGPVGTCLMNIGKYFSLVPDEQRLQGVAVFKQDFNAGVSWRSEVALAHNTADRSNSPSFPVLKAPIVPANNPGSIQAAATDPFFAQNLRFLGRAAGPNLPAQVSTTESDTWRVSSELAGDIGASSWRWSVAGSYSENELLFEFPDTLQDRFQSALNGQGGPNNNQFFNPYASGWATNDPAVIADFTGMTEWDGKTDLLVVDAVVSGEVFSLPAGNVGIAIGAQYRDETLEVLRDSASNQNAYAFTVGGPNFEGSRDVNAAFVELRLPLLPGFEAQLAGRYEDYGDLDTTDPKLALLWQPTEYLSLRASGGTSFRAPGLFQTISTTFTLDNIADPVVGGGATFQAVRTVGEPELVPEESVALNTGFTLQPSRNVQISVDYWSFDFEDIIVKQNSQLVVSAAAAGDPVAQAQVTRDPVTNRITSITTFFFNASSVKTDGVDLAASYSFDTPLGELSLATDWTRILSYKLKATDTSPEIDGAGRRNFLTFANPAPELRGTVTLGWSIGQSTVTAIGRYIDSYINDEGTPALPPQTIDSQTTLDLQYRYEWVSSFGGGGTTSFGLGVINAFDEDPPLVRTQTGYDPRVFDPRGRMVYANLKHRF